MNDLSLKQKICSFLLKGIAFVSAVAGTALSAYAGRNSFMGGSTVFMYFTIQSNIALAVICCVGAILMLANKTSSSVWHVIKFVGTVSITLTGVVFCFILAPTMGKYAWNIQNILTHVVVPIACVLDFFVVGSITSIKKRNVVFVIIPPILYAVYAGIGYVQNWQFSYGVNYPYFFLNWGSPAGAFGFTKEFPFMGTMWWIISLFIFLIIVGFAYLGILGAIKKSAKKHKHLVQTILNQSSLILNC